MTPAQPITEAQAQAARAVLAKHPSGSAKNALLAKYAPALLAFYDAAIPLLRELRELGHTSERCEWTTSRFVCRCDKDDRDAVLAYLLPPEETAP